MTDPESMLDAYKRVIASGVHGRIASLLEPLSAQERACALALVIVHSEQYEDFCTETLQTLVASARDGIRELFAAGALTDIPEA